SPRRSSTPSATPATARTALRRPPSRSSPGNDTRGRAGPRPTSPFLVTIRFRADRCHEQVGADGAGGADTRNGTGLSGMERRLATFEFTDAVRAVARGGTIMDPEVRQPESPRRPRLPQPVSVVTSDR